jgi:hypothetical protein
MYCKMRATRHRIISWGKLRAVFSRMDHLRSDLFGEPRDRIDVFAAPRPQTKVM